MDRKLTRDEMIEVIRSVLGLSAKDHSESEIDRQVMEFCVSSPDPAASMSLLVETDEPGDPERFVDKVLGLPPRSLDDVPPDELSLDHPMRKMARRLAGHARTVATDEWSRRSRAKKRE